MFNTLFSNNASIWLMKSCFLVLSFLWVTLIDNFVKVKRFIHFKNTVRTFFVCSTNLERPMFAISFWLLPLTKLSRRNWTFIFPELDFVQWTIGCVVEINRRVTPIRTFNYYDISIIQLIKSNYNRSWSPSELSFKTFARHTHAQTHIYKIAQ